MKYLLSVAAVFVAATGIVTAQRAVPHPAGIEIEPGYFLRPVVTGLDFPTAIATSTDRLWVVEAGVAGPPARIKEVRSTADRVCCSHPAICPRANCSRR